MIFQQKRSIARLLAALGLALLLASAQAHGAETPAYPFKNKPLDLLPRLVELQKFDPGAKDLQPLPRNALELLARIDRDQALTADEMAEIHLIASGVTDRKELFRYRKQLAELTAAARKATASAKNAREKAEALLRLLHAGPMAKGYDAGQTDLDELLDTGKFNCVSATVLYHIIARRLELDVKAISIPSSLGAGHVMTMLVVDGQDVDVETTNAEGFDFRARTKKAGATILGVTHDPNTGHAVSDLGLASLISQNRAGSQSKEKRYVAALLDGLIGLALDPHENAKANNFLASTNDWALTLSEEKKFEPALKVMQLAFDVLPTDSGIVNNYQVLWSRYAKSEFEAGRAASAVDVLRRGEKLFPQERFGDKQASLFVSPALDLADAGKWDEGVALLELGMPLVDAKQRDELRKWITQVFLRRAKAQREAGRFDELLVTFKQATAKLPDDRDIQETIAYTARKNLQELIKTSPAKAAEFLAAWRKEFPKIELLAKVGHETAFDAVADLVKVEKFAEAAAALDDYAPLIAGEAGLREISEYLYDRWAGKHFKQGEFAAAVKIYADALQKAPASSHLKNNAIATWDGWAQRSMAAKDWSEAIKVYEQALAQFPADSHLTNNLKYCRQQLAAGEKEQARR